MPAAVIYEALQIGGKDFRCILSIRDHAKSIDQQEREFFKSDAVSSKMGFQYLAANTPASTCFYVEMRKKNIRCSLRMPMKLENLLIRFVFQAIDIFPSADFESVEKSFLLDLKTLLKCEVEDFRSSGQRERLWDGEEKKSIRRLPA